MSQNPIEKYIWLVDTLKQRGKLTRQQISELWSKSMFSKNGEGMCRRTFHNYKNAIESLFDIKIAYNPATFEYHIEEPDEKGRKLTDWLLNSAAVNSALVSSADISDRILLEDVPSARGPLPVVMNTLRASTRLKFDYHNYTRSRPTRGVVLEPYLARIFKQRWYVIGRNVSEDKIKTYALDRMSEVTDTAEMFDIPDWFCPGSYFEYSFGIVVNRSEPKEIVLRTDHHYAKYLEALPLHDSQQQSVHDTYCLFRYRMQVTDDLVQELLSHGSRLVVEEPRELRMRIKEELKRSLEEYEKTTIHSSLRKTGLPVTDVEVAKPSMKKHKRKRNDSK